MRVKGKVCLQNQSSLSTLIIHWGYNNDYAIFSHLSSKYSV